MDVDPVRNESSVFEELHLLVDTSLSTIERRERRFYSGRRISEQEDLEEDD
jgi:hypothetical protein